MTHIHLFFSVIYWGILARLYIKARTFCTWYEARSNTPLVVFDGGKEWKVTQ